MDQTAAPNPAAPPAPSFITRQKPFLNLLITWSGGGGGRGEIIPSGTKGCGLGKKRLKIAHQVRPGSPSPGRQSSQSIGEDPPIIKLDVFEKPRHCRGFVPVNL